jgi:hypothetical protein
MSAKEDMPNKFDTEACRQYIAQHVISNPGCIIEIFKDPEADPLEDNCFWLEPDFEAAAQSAGNWKRRLKFKEGKNTIREFENRAYEYTVLATVVENGSKFIAIDFSAE